MMIVLSPLFLPTQVFCRLNLPQEPHRVSIKGPEHETLYDFFARFDRRQAHGQVTDDVRRLLLHALPDVYGKSCTGVVSYWGAAAEGSAVMTVKVLHVEGRRQEKPVRVLIAYGCFSTAKEYATRFRDERLAVLVVDRNSSHLSTLPNGKDCENCPDLTRITLDKVIGLFGRTVVGLSFLTTSDNPCCTGPSSWKEERVNYYVMKDGGVKPAGSALKKRWVAEHNDAGGVLETDYSASIIFKKDMKGNIVGILAPYTLKQNGRILEKGMARYNWINESEEFRRE
jgi:hypothetical protein